jgi:uncharacterized protein CbrC (UPF0167 family)
VYQICGERVRLDGWLSEVWLTHIGEAGVDIGEGEEAEKLGCL